MRIHFLRNELFLINEPKAWDHKLNRKKKIAEGWYAISKNSRYFCITASSSWTKQLMVFQQLVLVLNHIFLWYAAIRESGMIITKNYVNVYETTETFTLLLKNFSFKHLSFTVAPKERQNAVTKNFPSCSIFLRFISNQTIRQEWKVNQNRYQIQ